MDVYPQIILNSSVLLFGILCLMPFTSRMSVFTFIGLSWFLAWGIVALSEIFLVVSGVHVSLLKIGLLSLCILGMIWITIVPRSLKEGIEVKYCLSVIGVFALSVLCFILLANFANYMHYSTDSITNEGLSRIFHKYGVYSDGKSRLFNWLFNVRLPFYVAIHNIAYLSGIKIFYSFLSANSIFVAVTILGMWIDEQKKCLFCSIISMIVIICTYFSNKLIIFHSFYSLSNLTTMAYYTIGILSLYRYRENQENLWFITACLFLGITSIIRKEMLCFSLLPFIVVFKDLRPNIKTLFMGFCVYILSAYLWYIWGIINLKGISEVFFQEGLKVKGHGSLLLQILCFIGSFFIFFSPWKAIKKVGFFKLNVVFITVSLPILFYYKDAFSSAGYKMYLLMFMGKGEWGYSWYLIAIAFCLFISANILSKYGFWEIQERNSDLLAYVIVCFMVLRLLLYAVFGGLKDDSWNNSGNRMLLHIYPICLYFLAQYVYGLFGKVVPDKVVSD